MRGDGSSRGGDGGEEESRVTTDVGAADERRLAGVKRTSDMPLGGSVGRQLIGRAPPLNAEVQRLAEQIEQERLKTEN